MTDVPARDPDTAALRPPASCGTDIGAANGPTRRGRRGWPVLILVSAIVAGGAYAYRQNHAPAPRSVAAVASAPDVKAAVATLADVPIATVGLGTVQAYNTVTVKPRVGGQIMDVSFTEGQMIAAGSVLAHIDQRSFLAPLHQAEANLAKDEAQLDNVEADLGRTSNLAQKGYATNQALDTQKNQSVALKAQILADHAAVEAAKTQVDYTTVTAPIGGVAGMRMVDAGNVITPSDPGFVVINQIEPISVVFTVPSSAVAGWPVGVPDHTVPVAALVPDNSREIAQGTLSLVDNHIDASTGTIKLKATFPNKDRALKPGQFVNARVETEQLRGVVTVPVGAVQPGQSGSFVFVVAGDGTLEQRSVTVQRSTADLAVIASGLKPGETVVTEGQYMLRPGSKVVAHVAAKGAMVGASASPAID